MTVRSIFVSAGISVALVVLSVAVAGYVFKPAEHQLTPAGVPRNFSTYVEMRDGVRLAVDVWLPAELAADHRIPTLIKGTPYWRAHQLTFLGKAFAAFGFNVNPVEPDIGILGKRGYAVAVVDARGTGASFGTQTISYSKDEIADYDEIIDWVTRQAWSNGRVGAYGSCYRGVTAAHMASFANPALKAVAPLYDMSDWFLTSYPGGLFNTHLAKTWSELASGLNRGVPRCKNFICRWLVAGPKRVDEDRDGALLAQALASHVGGYKVYECLRDIGARDSPICDAGSSMADVSLLARKDAIERRALPMYVQAGYLDGSSPAQALHRFQTFSNPQKIVIGPLSHGGFHDTDPFKPVAAKADPSFAKQTEMVADFFDGYLKEGVGAAREKEITYYVSGADVWRTSATWPPAGVRSTPWYFDAEHRLSPRRPTDDSGADEYRVDFAATTGSTSRHRSQVDFSKTAYPNLAEQAARLLTYTSEPMTADVELIGNPVARLKLASSHSDGAVIVYLHDVAADGKVTYLTEGVLRLAHRKAASDGTSAMSSDPFHTYLARDMAPMPPGKVEDIAIALSPLSVLVRHGHRLRVAIGGTDAGNLEQLPADGTPTLTIQRNAFAFSSIELPILVPGK